MLNRLVAFAALAAGGYLLSKQMKKPGTQKALAASSVEESIEVGVPVSVAYNQWTQFEDFPKFMDNVHEVRQLDNQHLRWRADVAGIEKQWDAEITEQTPDQRIAWRSISGAKNSGVITFHKISDSTTKIMLQMEFQPEGVTEHVGDMLGTVRRQTKDDLKRFKEFIESRGKETGAWRGTVVQH